MSLLEMQKVLCLMLTDGTYRRAYTADQDGFLSQFTLTSDETAALKSLNTKRMFNYSGMLIATRLEFALKSLPNARGFLSTNFIGKYGPEYVRRFPPIPSTDIPPLLRELQFLTPFLEELAARGDISGDGFIDVLRYDATMFTLGNDPAIYKQAVIFEQLPPVSTHSSIQTMRPALAPSAVIQTFTHDVLQQTKLDGEILKMASPSKPLHVLFHKRPAEGGIRLLTVSSTTKALLEACDGRTSIITIAEELTQGTSTANTVLGKCESMLRTFSDRRLIAFRNAQDNMRSGQEI